MASSTADIFTKPMFRFPVRRPASLCSLQSVNYSTTESRYRRDYSQPPPVSARAPPRREGPYWRPGFLLPQAIAGG